jgi:uncharacterized membrane protein
MPIATWLIAGCANPLTHKTGRPRSAKLGFAGLAPRIAEFIDNGWSTRLILLFVLFCGCPPVSVPARSSRFG